MAKLKRPIKASELPDNTVPAGKYKLRLIKFEDKQSQNNKNSRYYAATFEVLDKRYKGMRIFEMFNYQNDNESAVRIGCSNLKKLIIGIFGKEKDVDDDKQLIGKVFYADVITVSNDQYGEQNKIGKYLEPAGKSVNSDDDTDSEKDDDADDWAEGKEKKKDKNK